jgi:polysaccharide biosynthesis/export protein
MRSALHTVFSSATAAAFTALLLVSGVPALAQQAKPAAGPSGAPVEYMLGSGDVVRITVFQNPDLTLECHVG